MINDQFARLAWSCRRGMLELDLLLGNFLRESYENLSVEELSQFKCLLECSDPELFDYLLGHSKPPSQDLVEIVTKIKAHARSRI